MAIRLRAARHCDRCDKYLKDVDGDATTAIKGDESRKPVFVVQHGDKVTKYLDLCPKCDKRLGDLYVAVTLDKDAELPQVPPIDTSRNSLVEPEPKPAGDLLVEGAQTPKPVEPKSAAPPEEEPETYDRAPLPPDRKEHAEPLGDKLPGSVGL